MELKFDCLYDRSRGILPPEYLKFLYYDICFDYMQGNPEIYKWDSEIEFYLHLHHLTIEPCEVSTLTETFEADKILFGVYPQETKPHAFFRHIRNAFAHFNINNRGDYFIMMDNSGSQITMIGKIKYNDLKEICFLFFNQREEMRIKEETRNSY